MSELTDNALKRAADMGKQIEICERAGDDSAAASYAAAAAQFESAAMIIAAIETLSLQLILAIDESGREAAGLWRGGR